ncbi:MAG TPA: cytochrome C oxidase subunit IV family protein [bacterium]|nr:cytochrome C oxidase subunit IV family protein [bacterium]
MTEATQQAPTRAYLVAWVVLLFLTAIEVSVVLVFTLPTVVRVTILLISALIKASLIGAYYMNLKFERLAMVYIALIPLLLGVLMFFAIVPDAARVMGLR